MMNSSHPTDLKTKSLNPKESEPSNDSKLKTTPVTFNGLIIEPNNVYHCGHSKACQMLWSNEDVVAADTGKKEPYQYQVLKEMCQHFKDDENKKMVAENKSEGGCLSDANGIYFRFKGILTCGGFTSKLGLFCSDDRGVEIGRLKDLAQALRTVMDQATSQDLTWEGESFFQLFCYL